MSSPDWARPIVYMSIQAVDQKKQREFYSQLFNWDIADEPFMFFPAGPGSPENGISGHISGGPTPGFNVYIQVRDIHASLIRAVELGGTQVSEPFQIPGRAMIAGITDPEGNALTLVQQ